MIAWLIECRHTDSTHWAPIAVAGVENPDMVSDGIIDQIRKEHPALCKFSLRVRRFRRIPGLATDDKLNGQIVVLENEKPIPIEP